MATWWTTTILGPLLGVCLPVALEARQAGAGGPAPPGPRIRAMDRISSTLLTEALRRSSTVRALVAEIETCEVVVFLVTSNEPGNWRGETKLMSMAGSVRLLRVKISTGLEPWERIAVLAHELQHVLEVAAAPDVVDSDGMRRLFERIGHPIGPTGRVYETVAAQAIERRVRDEIGKTGVQEVRRKRTGDREVGSRRISRTRRG